MLKKDVLIVIGFIKRAKKRLQSYEKDYIKNLEKQLETETRISSETEKILWGMYQRKTGIHLSNQYKRR